MGCLNIPLFALLSVERLHIVLCSTDAYLINAMFDYIGCLFS